MSWNTERGQKPMTAASAKAILAHADFLRSQGILNQDPRLPRAQRIINPLAAETAYYARRSAVTSKPPEIPPKESPLVTRDLTPPLTESLTATEFCGPRNNNSGCGYFIAPNQCDLHDPLIHLHILKMKNCFSARVDGALGDMTREGFQPEISD